MIFTPCKDGLSHNEAESIEPEEAEAGARCCSRRWWRGPIVRCREPHDGGFQSARSGVHCQSLSGIPHIARDHTGVAFAVRPDIPDPLRRRFAVDARSPNGQGLHRARGADPSLRPHRDAGARGRRVVAHDADARSARSHAAARPRDQGIHRAQDRGNAAGHSGDHRPVARQGGRRRSRWMRSATSRFRCRCW